MERPARGIQEADARLGKESPGRRGDFLVLLVEGQLVKAWPMQFKVGGTLTRSMVLDVETARQAGVQVVLVPGGSSSATELRATGERVLAGLPDLLSLLPPRAPAATGLTRDGNRA